MNTRQVLYLIGLMVILIVVVAVTGTITLFMGSIIPALFIILISAVMCVALFCWLIYVRLFTTNDVDRGSES